VIIATSCNDVLIKGKSTDNNFIYGGESYPTSFSAKKTAESIDNQFLLDKNIIKNNNSIK
jgi:hypothetical protein